MRVNHQTEKLLRHKKGEDTIYTIIDIGGSYVKHCLMDEKGIIQEHGKFKTPLDSLESFLNALFSIVEKHKKVGSTGISICCPGIVDSDAGVVYYGGHVPLLHEVNLKQIFNQKYDLPVFVENDGKAAALAELWMNEENRSKNIIVLILGSGIGGGIIVNGELLRGKNFSAGEVSYMIEHIHEDSKKVNLYGYEASAPRMMKRICELNGLEETAEGEDIFNYIYPENELSWNVFRNYSQKIAKMILSLQHIIDPDKFIISGGITKQPMVLNQIRAEIKEIQAYEHPPFLSTPIIEQSKILDGANLHGSLYHILQRTGKQTI